MRLEVVHSEKVYEGRAFGVRRDEVRLATGRVAHIDIIEHVPSVTLIPVDAQGQVWFVRQYRHPTGETLLELPAGTLSSEEDPEACARRECREEIGMAPGRLTLLGSCYLAPGYSTEYMYFYLAEDLVPSPLSPDEDEVLKVERLTVARAYEMAAGGALRDAKSIVGLHLASLLLQPG
ncbi:MAG: NUDIX hydrolase [Chloroflexota bacterium]